MIEKNMNFGKDFVVWVSILDLPLTNFVILETLLLPERKTQMSTLQGCVLKKRRFKAYALIASTAVFFKHGCS